MKKIKNTHKRNLLLALLAFTIILFDQLTKYVVRTNIPLNASLPLFHNLFSFTYVTNTGVSFGLFKGSNWLFMIIAVVALAFFIYTCLKNQEYATQFTIICAGIIGNLIDRVFLGHVIDFVDFRLWPIFNVADSAVFLGITWLLVLLVLRKDDLK